MAAVKRHTFEDRKEEEIPTDPLERENPILSALGESGCASLKAIRRLLDAKGVADRAEALRVLAKRIGHGLALQNRAAEIKIRAERRGGEILAESIDKKGGRPPKKRGHHVSVLADPWDFAEAVEQVEAGGHRSEAMKWAGEGNRLSLGEE